MNTLLKIFTLTTAFAVLVGCGAGDENKKAKAARDSGNNKINEIVSIETTELIYFPTEESKINQLKVVDAAYYKVRLERVIQLGTDVLRIDDNNKNISIKNRGDFERIIESRKKLLVQVDARLKSLNALDAKGKLKPEHQPKIPAKDSKHQHKH